ncbi:TadE/TadG family type IV pilus assembly protein [Streptomyces sp. 7-21]|uniref:TadE/TadG family type IV pilus assembly protein n=1 Tax=Streptomyces sp. 7-21 TaxID=2802283 RepID=UPI00191F0CBF|nr:TadE/TadG family type IV pilus assembly protein [Streptomyces sp. 7-21]MBL1065803.1 pilus assembly protein [Streptomyces sp. 7-21]
MTGGPGGGPATVIPARCRGAGRDRGAVLVEFAGLFPLILVMMAAIWQCVLIGYAFSRAANAADVGARAGAAASSGAESACVAAATDDLPGGWDAEVSCPLEGNVRTARVELRVPAIFPGGLNLPLTVSGTAGAAEEG